MTNELGHAEIATAIWRAGFFTDKNKVRQAAKESVRSLIAHDIAGSFRHADPAFDVGAFLKDCGVLR